jgi:predicted nuclease of predicted toxin-antitoxin system
MKLLLDESADFPLATFLSELNHDVTVVARDYPYALTDQEVLAIAYAEQRILITNDRDFGELIFRQRLSHRGVILFRLGEESLSTKSARLQHVLTNHSEELQNFIVITGRGVRIRRSTDS